MILMLNCSYKVNDVNTQFFLEQLKAELSGEQLQIVPLRQVLGGGFSAAGRGRSVCAGRTGKGVS